MAILSFQARDEEASSKWGKTSPINGLPQTVSPANLSIHDAERLT